jgi:DNA mismatch endonuclease, patch repair protein
MTDTFSPTKRSAIMRSIKSKDSKPEMAVRSITHGMGYRYRLHQADLPGKPDLVFRGRGKVIFVHGCFWHGHAACKGGHVPKSNQSYWTEKIQRNRSRDTRALRKLRSAGWSVMVVWECETRELSKLAKRIRRFLER